MCSFPEFLTHFYSIKSVGTYKFEHNQTLLHLIASNNHAYLIPNLDKSHILVNTQDDHGDTALVLALKLKHHLVVDRLLRDFKD